MAKIDVYFNNRLVDQPTEIKEGLAYRPLTIQEVHYVLDGDCAIIATCKSAHIAALIAHLLNEYVYSQVN